MYTLEEIYKRQNTGTPGFLAITDNRSWYYWHGWWHFLKESVPNPSVYTPDTYQVIMMGYNDAKGEAELDAIFF